MLNKKDCQQLWIFMCHVSGSSCDIDSLLGVILLVY